MPTPWTAETLWPAQGEQIVAASLLARKARLEFELVARVILHQALHYILGSPESSGYPANGIVRSISHHRTFDSAAECLAALKQLFAGQTVTTEARGFQPGGSEVRKPKSVPKFLFRGEPDLYPTTLPGCSRLANDDSLDSTDREQLSTMVGAMCQWLSSPESNFFISEHHAEGLLQHLGLPTRYIDFSEDPEVALAFAVGGRTYTDGRRARICLLDVVRGKDEGRGCVAQFRDHLWCERARRQKAYGYGPIRFQDLKEGEACEEVGLRWFEFGISRTDVDLFEPRYRALLDENSDSCAGVLRVMINDYAIEAGPLRVPVAQWLTSRVPTAPLIARIVSFYEGQLSHRPKDLEFLPPKDYPCDPDEERRCSVECWSDPSRSCFEDEPVPTHDRNIWRFRQLIHKVGMDQIHSTGADSEGTSTPASSP